MILFICLFESKEKNSLKKLRNILVGCDKGKKFLAIRNNSRFCVLVNPNNKSKIYKIIKNVVH